MKPQYKTYEVYFFFNDRDISLGRFDAATKKDAIAKCKESIGDSSYFPLFAREASE